MTNEITSNVKQGLQQVARITGWIVSRAVLVIIYLVVFMPVGMIIRLFDRDPLNRKLDPAVTTYYQPSKQRTAGHMEKPY